MQKALRKIYTVQFNFARAAMAIFVLFTHKKYVK